MPLRLFISNINMALQHSGGPCAIHGTSCPMLLFLIVLIAQYTQAVKLSTQISYTTHSIESSDVFYTAWRYVDQSQQQQKQSQPFIRRYAKSCIVIELIWDEVALCSPYHCGENGYLGIDDQSVDATADNL